MEVSKYGDMYSYGALLLEMFTGKRPTDGMFSGNVNLPSFARTAFPGRVMDIADPNLQLDESFEDGEEHVNGHNKTFGERIQQCLMSVFQIGIACSATKPQERMDIRDVCAQLAKAREALLGDQVVKENQFLEKREASPPDGEGETSRNVYAQWSTSLR